MPVVFVSFLKIFVEESVLEWLSRDVALPDLFHRAQQFRQILTCGSCHQVLVPGSIPVEQKTIRFDGLVQVFKMKIFHHANDMVTVSRIPPVKIDLLVNGFLWGRKTDFSHRRFVQDDAKKGISREFGRKLAPGDHLYTQRGQKAVVHPIRPRHDAFAHRLAILKNTHVGQVDNARVKQRSANRCNAAVAAEFIPHRFISRCGRPALQGQDDLSFFLKTKVFRLQIIHLVLNHQRSQNQSGRNHELEHHQSFAQRRHRKAVDKPALQHLNGPKRRQVESGINARKQAGEQGQDKKAPDQRRLGKGQIPFCQGVERRQGSVRQCQGHYKRNQRKQQGFSEKLPNQVRFGSANGFADAYLTGSFGRARSG